MPGRIVYNTDIAGLHARINRFVIEQNKSASANFAGINTFDQARFKSYLSALRTYHAWMTSQPQLDLPETGPLPVSLEPDPIVIDVDNESVNDLLRMLTALREEVINSQSARVPTGMIGFDSIRFLAQVEKMEKFIDDYVAKVTPLDLPESSPAAPMNTLGNVGV